MPRIVRYTTPYTDFARLSNLADRLSANTARPVRRAPAFPVDITADEDGFTVVANLPGITADQVSLNVLENRITIRIAEQTEAATDDTRHTLWRERPTLHGLQRSFNLPASVDTSAAHASLTDGVLTVRLPLAETAKPRTVAITVAA